MNKIFTNDVYTLRATVTRVPTLDDCEHLQITSQFSGAKEPNEKHALLDVFLNRAGLVKLQAIIGLALLKQPKKAESHVHTDPL